MSTYSSNVSMINNYIVPIIGGDKLENINTRFYRKVLSATAQDSGCGQSGHRKTAVRVCVTGNDPGYP